MWSGSDYACSIAWSVRPAQIGHQGCVPDHWNDGGGRTDGPAYVALALALLGTTTAATTILVSDPQAGFGLTLLLCGAAFITAVVALRRPRTQRGVAAAVIAAVIGAIPYVLVAYLLILAATCEDCFS